VLLGGLSAESRWMAWAAQPKPLEGTAIDAYFASKGIVSDERR
jgi:hypothetical protein